MGRTKERVAVEQLIINALNELTDVRIEHTMKHLLDSACEECYIDGYLQARHNAELYSHGVVFLIHLFGGLALPLFQFDISVLAKYDKDARVRKLKEKIKAATARAKEFYHGLIMHSRRPPRLVIDNPSYNSQTSVKIIAQKFRDERYIGQYIESLFGQEIDSKGIDYIFSIEGNLWFIFQVKPGSRSEDELRRKKREESVRIGHSKRHPFTKFVLFVRWWIPSHLRTIQWELKRVMFAQIMQTYFYYRDK